MRIVSGVNLEVLKAAIFKFKKRGKDYEII